MADESITCIPRSLENGMFVFGWQKCNQMPETCQLSHYCHLPTDWFLSNNFEIAKNPIPRTESGKEQSNWTSIIYLYINILRTFDFVCIGNRHTIICHSGIVLFSLFDFIWRETGKLEKDELHIWEDARYTHMAHPALHASPANVEHTSHWLTANRNERSTWRNWRSCHHKTFMRFAIWQMQIPEIRCRSMCRRRRKSSTNLTAYALAEGVVVGGGSQIVTDNDDDIFPISHDDDFLSHQLWLRCIRQHHIRFLSATFCKFGPRQSSETANNIFVNRAIYSAMGGLHKYSWGIATFPSNAPMPHGKRIHTRSARYLCERLSHFPRILSLAHTATRHGLYQFASL